MGRQEREVTCPSCGHVRKTKAHGGIALVCPGCGDPFICPTKPSQPRQRSSSDDGAAPPPRVTDVEEPAGSPDRDVPPPDPAASSGDAVEQVDGVTIRRVQRAGVTRPSRSTPPPPDAAEVPAEEPAEPAPVRVDDDPAPRRGARSHRRNRRSRP